MGKLSKADKDKVAKMRGDALRYVETMDEKDKEALSVGAEIMVKMCNKLNIGFDMMVFLYLSALRKAPLMIEYNNKVVDHKVMLTTVSGSEQFHIRREAVYMRDTVMTESEVEYLVDLGLLEKDILSQKIHSYDTVTKVWDLGEYLTQEARMILEQLEPKGAIEYGIAMGRFIELWEIWPRQFSGSNGRVWPAKRSDKEWIEEVAKTYGKHVADDVTHGKVMRYAKENSHRFMFGLKNFVDNKQWEGNLVNEPKTDLNNLL
jgi:hypothetical protein